MRKMECTFGSQYCCLECPENDTCKLQCDYMDAYEYAVECPDYAEEVKDFSSSFQFLEGSEKMNYPNLELIEYKTRLILSKDRHMCAYDRLFDRYPERGGIKAFEEKR